MYIFLRDVNNHYVLWYKFYSLFLRDVDGRCYVIRIDRNLGFQINASHINHWPLAFTFVYDNKKSTQTAAAACYVIK